MTRDEFFRQRAVADFLKRHGVTVCPPGVAATLTDEPRTRRPRGHFAHRPRFAHRIDPVTGDGLPDRDQRNMPDPPNERKRRW